MVKNDNDNNNNNNNIKISTHGTEIVDWPPAGYSHVSWPGWCF